MNAALLEAVNSLTPVQLAGCGPTTARCVPMGGMPITQAQIIYIQQQSEIKAKAESAASENPVSVTDFHAYMPDHTYIYIPTLEMWPAASVNARIPMSGEKANRWLDFHRPVDQMTWCPGKPMLIEDTLVSDGGWIHRKGAHCFNLYRPPTQESGNPDKATPWIDHLELVFPNDAPHITKWLAHRTQRPGEKINHALVLLGKQGIGKDTILEPIKLAVGPDNFAEITPAQSMARFNGFLKSVILRISEMRDQGDAGSGKIDRYAFYEHTKGYIASPPDVLRCDEKFRREYSVFNVMGVILTSNHTRDGLYLPADDRRHFVAASELSKEDFTQDYWNRIYQWYANGGNAHVAAYLRELDLSDFDPKAPPPKTEAFYAVVDASRTPEDADMADVLDALGNPKTLTLFDVMLNADEPFKSWLQDRRNSRQIGHRMVEAGYEPVRNSAAKDGLWVIEGKRQAIYARSNLTVRERQSAAAEFCERFRRPAATREDMP